MTKLYHTGFIFTQYTLDKLKLEGKEGKLLYRRLDEVKVTGHDGPLQIYEAIGTDSPIANNIQRFESSLGKYEVYKY